MKTCFVIMPIRSGLDFELHLNRYKHIIEAAVSGARKDGNVIYDCRRADMISKTGSITRKVIREIYNADVVIADLTELNPNVFYELGVRHALRDATILVALEGTDIPFDVGDLQVVKYHDRVGGEKQVVPILRELLERFADAPPTDDSPVFMAVPELRIAETRPSHELETKLAASQRDVDDLRLKLAIAEETGLRVQRSFQESLRALRDVMRHIPQGDRAGHIELLRSTYAAPASLRSAELASSAFVVDPNFAFVLMPLRKELANIYGLIRRACAKLKITVTRADDITTTGNIMTQVIGQIQKAGIIIADVSGQNPNVMYEVGIAHTLQKPTIVICDKKLGVPFDLASTRVIFYGDGVNEVDFEVTLEMFLHQIIDKYRGKTG